MPTLEEYKQWEAQARKDAEDYRWWARLHPSRAKQYEDTAENRLYHAEAYRRDAERLENMERVNAAGKAE